MPTAPAGMNCGAPRRPSCGTTRRAARSLCSSCTKPPSSPEPRPHGRPRKPATPEKHSDSPPRHGRTRMADHRHHRRPPVTARRAARAAAAQQAEPPVFDYRDPQYGIPRWPPAPDNPVPLSLIRQARRRAREARKAWEHEHGQHNSPAQQTAPEPTPTYAAGTPRTAPQRPREETTNPPEAPTGPGRTGLARAHRLNGADQGAASEHVPSAVRTPPPGDTRIPGRRTTGTQG